MSPSVRSSPRSPRGLRCGSAPARRVWSAARRAGQRGDGRTTERPASDGASGEDQARSLQQRRVERREAARAGGRVGIGRRREEQIVVVVGGIVVGRIGRGGSSGSSSGGSSGFELPEGSRLGAGAFRSTARRPIHFHWRLERRLRRRRCPLGAGAGSGCLRHRRRERDAADVAAHSRRGREGRLLRRRRDAGSRAGPTTAEFPSSRHRPGRGRVAGRELAPRHRGQPGHPSSRS